MPEAALRELLSGAGLDAEQRVAFSGADPVFPTRYRMASAGAAALGAVGVAATRLWKSRGGQKQEISVDLRAAAASLRSSRYMQINGKPLPPQWDPLSGYYPVNDGWISVHCNFENHRDAAYSVLQSPHDRKEGEARSASWQGEELENAIHAAGGCAGFVRSHADWDRHPHARAVAEQPLIQIERIGDAPPRKLASAARPLDGVRVLDLTRVLAGPSCAKTLAEHGADVLKISAAHLPDSGLVELDTGIGKRSARLDLRNNEELGKLKQLVRDADVFSQSYRPGALAKRGLSPEDLARLHPGIVCVTLSAWGTTGPWAQRRGYDSIVQSVSGMAHAMGKFAAPDGKPALQPVSAIDYVTGSLMAFGAMVALERRAREGGSWVVRVALARVGKWIVDRGIVPDAEWRAAPADLTDAEIAALTTEVDAPDGRIRFLAPVVRLPSTPPHWTRPPVPLGTHAPAWEEKAHA